MSLEDAPRCFDCFAELNGRRFAVLKQMRDMPPNAQGTEEGLAFLKHGCFDPVAICADCAEWYGDEALPVGEPQP